MKSIGELMLAATACCVAGGAQVQPADRLSGPIKAGVKAMSLSVMQLLAP